MSGRYYRVSERQEIISRFEVAQVGDFVVKPEPNAAPTTLQPVIRLERNTREREMVQMRWGLIPSFAQSLAEFRTISTVNARAESLTTSASWRISFQRRRCLVPANGFYEWKEIGAGLRPPSQSYDYSLRDGALFAFAGLWDAWREPKPHGRHLAENFQVWVHSFAIITTAANELITPVHHRMPVILHHDDWAEWLALDDNADDSRPGPLHLLRPYESGAMRMNASHRLVKKKGTRIYNRPTNSA